MTRKNQENKSDRKNSLPRQCLSIFGTMCIAELICILLMFVLFSLAGNSVAGGIIAQVIAALLFYGMIYGSVWSLGAADKNKISFGRIPKDSFKGLKIGSILMLPQLILNIMLICEKLGVQLKIFSFGLYKVLNSHIWPLINVLTSTGNDEAPYFIMEIADVGWGTTEIFVLTMFILPILCAVAYVLGLKEISFRNNVVYKK